MIKTQVIGHLGKDAVVNTVNGKTVINFSVAHTEKFKDATGQQKDKTTWVDCSSWTDKTAIAPYLKKGTQVYVEGTPDSRAYLTADNKPASSISLRVSSIQLLGSPEKNEVTNAEGKREYAPNNAPIAEEDGDLPF
jgi:single-strand DNA-binding protein